MTVMYENDRCVILLANKEGKVIGVKCNGKEIPLLSFSINETCCDDIQTATITVPMRIEIKGTE